MNPPASLPLTLRLRVPVFAPGTPTSAKVEQLEEYLLVSAFRIGEMHEERVELEGQLKDVDEEWSAVDGYQPLMRSKTDTAAEEAKAMLRPDLAQRRRDLKHWLKQLEREIGRLDDEGAKVSRAYTMIVGS